MESLFERILSIGDNFISICKELQGKSQKGITETIIVWFKQGHVTLQRKNRRLNRVLA